MLWLKRSSGAAPITWNDPRSWERSVSLGFFSTLKTPGFIFSAKSSVYSLYSGRSATLFRMEHNYKSRLSNAASDLCAYSLLHGGIWDLVFKTLGIINWNSCERSEYGSNIWRPNFLPDAPDVWTFASGERRRRDQTGWLSIIRTPRPLSEENNPSAEEREFASGVYGALM